MYRNQLLLPSVVLSLQSCVELRTLELSHCLQPSWSNGTMLAGTLPLRPWPHLHELLLVSTSSNVDIQDIRALIGACPQLESLTLDVLCFDALPRLWPEVFLSWLPHQQLKQLVAPVLRIRDAAVARVFSERMQGLQILECDGFSHPLPQPLTSLTQLTQRGSNGKWPDALVAASLPALAFGGGHYSAVQRDDFGWQVIHHALRYDPAVWFDRLTYLRLDVHIDNLGEATRLVEDLARNVGPSSLTCECSSGRESGRNRSPTKICCRSRTSCTQHC